MTPLENLFPFQLANLFPFPLANLFPFPFENLFPFPLENLFPFVVRMSSDLLEAFMLLNVHGGGMTY